MRRTIGEIQIPKGSRLAKEMKKLAKGYDKLLKKEGNKFLKKQK